MNQSEIIIKGDINNDMINLISSHLKPENPDLKIINNSSNREAYAISPADLLPIAAAVAAVLNFLLNFSKELRDKKIRKNEKKVKEKIDDNLKTFKAEGFEVESVVISESKLREIFINSVKIKDVVDQVTIEIKQETEKKYSINRINYRN